MRDVIVIALVLAGALAALRRPWIGVLLWNWLSLMNPHRYTYGFAYDAPVAAIAAASTLVGLVMTRDRQWPIRGAPVVLLTLFMGWMTLSLLFGLDPSEDQVQWSKVMKVDLMILVAAALLSTKKHIMSLVWVCTASLALLGAKGGVFTVMTGGNYRVWGPPGTFIEDNNGFALALVMTIPLLRFLQMQLQSRVARQIITAVMVLVATSAFGSHSRGALLAIAAMALLMWWRGRSRILGGITIVAVAVMLISFMPPEWLGRMETIGTYDTDDSALGRFSAWWVAWRSALAYPLGLGFNASRPELFVLYSPYGLDFGTPGPHSIYFQVLGNHGFFGLALFIFMLLATLHAAGRVRKAAAPHPQAKWCSDLAGMCQVSLLGYMVGGAFLGLAYFDLPYNIIVMVVVTRSWVQRKAWMHETDTASRFGAFLGLAPAAPKLGVPLRRQGAGAAAGAD